MMPNLLGKLFDQFRVAFRIKTGPKQVAKVSGGGTITQLQAGGDINVEKVLVVDVTALPDVRALVERLQALEVRAEVPALPASATAEIDATAMAIIKAHDLDGSRIHLAFDVRNHSPGSAVTVTAATFTVNGCILRMKQFFVNTGQVRIPDPTTFPISIPPNSNRPMSIEFENADASILYTNGIEAELHLDSDRGSVAERFVLEGPQPQLVHVLGEMQKLVEVRKTAYPLDVPIAKRLSATGRP